MARILRVVVIVGVALGFGGGLAGCGPSKTGGPTDMEQEKRFIEKGQAAKPGGAPKQKTNGKAKAGEEKKEKAKVTEESKEKAKADEEKIEKAKVTEESKEKAKATDAKKDK